MAGWARGAGLGVAEVSLLPPPRGDAEGLTVCLWRLVDVAEKGES
jgi:hypothetical protein